MNPETLTVLLIEDNAEHVEFLSRLLAQSADSYRQFLLEVAEDLSSGLERLRPGDIDLVLLDLTLPDSEGLETFIRVMESAPDVAIVVLSGINDVALAIETVQLGAQDYLVKGRVDNHLLMRSLHYAIERKRIQREVQRSYEEMEVRIQERTAALQEAVDRLNAEIAERKRAEEQTQETNRQLAAALSQLRNTQEQVIRRERMHALGRMANGIAHDFNNALAPILGFSELLLLKPDLAHDEAKLRSYLEMIHSAAKEGAKVVGQLREFYRHRDSVEPFTPVVVNDLVEQVVTLTQPTWRDQALAAGVTIEIRTELGNVPTVVANEGELREALVNLVFNAVDAISKRGTITISTEVQGRWLVITVIDDGCGMTEEVKARCFEPFFTTKEGEGAGLGLGSVYGIVRRHDGEIDIQSEPGRGTSVAISLPLDRGDKPQAPRPGSAATEPLRVLVVEDEPMVREVLGVYLSEDNHEVTMAENGREGLQKFCDGTFDIVLTDRAMPEMNGDELAAEIKKIRPDQPVVLLTGFGDLMSGAGEQPEGVDFVVSKPFTLNTLRNAIQKAVKS